MSLGLSAMRMPPLRCTFAQTLLEALEAPPMTSLAQPVTVDKSALLLGPDLLALWNLLLTLLLLPPINLLNNQMTLSHDPSRGPLDLWRLCAPEPWSARASLAALHRFPAARRTPPSA